jgi:hypothetical protein
MTSRLSESVDGRHAEADRHQEPHRRGVSAAPPLDQSDDRHDHDQERGAAQVCHRGDDVDGRAAGVLGAPVGDRLVPSRDAAVVVDRAEDPPDGEGGAERDAPGRRRALRRPRPAGRRVALRAAHAATGSQLPPATCRELRHRSDRAVDDGFRRSPLPQRRRRRAPPRRGSPRRWTPSLVPPGILCPNRRGRRRATAEVTTDAGGQSLVLHDATYVASWHGDGVARELPHIVRQRRRDVLRRGRRPPRRRGALPIRLRAGITALGCTEHARHALRRRLDQQAVHLGRGAAARRRWAAGPRRVDPRVRRPHRHCHRPRGHAAPPAHAHQRHRRHRRGGRRRELCRGLSQGAVSHHRDAARLPAPVREQAATLRARQRISLLQRQLHRRGNGRRARLRSEASGTTSRRRCSHAPA